MPTRYTFLFFLLPAASLSAQSVSGYVRDASGQAIVFASVVASACADEQVLAYTNTDDKGFYRLRLQTDCDSVTLTARTLGYKTATVQFLRSELPETQDFQLEGTVLQEVLIRGKTPPVVARNDTTIYNVASFSDSTEFSVEDLLKKLPGAQVSESGRITLNGKEVERVLLEGDDLFNDNYHIATRNLRANMISKVQSIDKYQENPLMKGVQESDRLVLNLQVKEEKKRSLSGSATLGGGYGGEGKGFGHLNLFSFTKTDKTYLIGNANNTGYNSMGDVQAYSGNNPFDRNRQNLQNSPLRADAVLPTAPLESAGLPPVFSRTNRTGMLYLGHIMPITSSFKVKLSGWIGQDRLRQQVDYNTRYLLENGILELSEKRSSTQETGLRNFQAESDYFFPDKKQSLRSFIRISGSPEKGGLQLLRSANGAAPERIVQDLNGTAFQSLATFEYTLKTNAASALQITLKDAHFRGGQTLLPEYGFYPLFFGLDSSYTFLRQEVLQKRHLSMLDARYLSRRWGWNWVLEGGVFWEWNRLNSELRIRNATNMEWQAGDNFRNDFQMEAPQSFARISGYREMGRWYVSGGLNTRFYPVRLQNREARLDAADLLLAAPQAALRYTFSDKSSLALNYRYEQNLPRFLDYQPAYIFTDYQSARRGLPEVAVMPGQRAGLHFQFNERVKQFGWHASVSGQRNENQAGSAYQIDPYLFLQDLYRPVRTATYSLSSGAHRYFPALSSRFEAIFSLIGQQQENRINSALPRYLDTRIYTASLEYGSAFDGWVNVILNNQWFYSVAKNEQEQRSSTFTATNWQSSAQLVIKPSKRFNAKFNFYRFANRADQKPWNVSYAGQGECMLRLPRLRSSLQLSGVNLFGSRDFRQVSADAFVQSTTRVQAVTPFFLVAWDYSF